jgi:hypothetical protein
MNSLLNFFIEANLYLICFYLLYQILLAGDKHFRFNRAFLLGGITLSLLLPMLSININPSMESANAFEGYLMLPAITITEVRTESIGFILKWWQIIGMVYVAGMVFYLFTIIMANGAYHAASSPFQLSQGKEKRLYPRNNQRRNTYLFFL